MWTQPVLTANGTIGINNFAVASGGGAASDAYKAFDSSETSYCNKMNSGAWLEFYSAVTLTISDILITSQGGLPSQGIFQISHDAGTTWEQCGTWTDTDGLGESAHVIFDDGSATGRYFRFLSQGKSLAKPNNNADFCNVTITADEASGDFDFCADLERDIVHKSLLDEALKVWLPFDESTTKDLCWNGWTAYGSPTIQDNALYLPGSSSYLAMTDGITLGGQDFTIRGKFNMDSATGRWCRIFEIFNTSGSEADAIRLARDNTNSTLSFGCFDKSGTCSITLGTTYDFECCYVHSTGKFYLFLDGVLKVTLSVTVAKTSFSYCWLGRSNYSADGYFVGSIDEFQIYDGIALHTTNFTPPTDDDYAQAKADWDGRFSLIANTERKLTNQAWIDDALKTYLTFDASPIDDLKGNTWTTYGNPTIGLNNSFTGHALQLDGSSYIKLSSIQLGGKSFYVDGWVYVDSSSPNNARVIHIVNPSTGYGLVSVRKNKDNASRLDFWTNSYADVSKDSGQTRVSTIDSIGQLVHFKLVYRYDNKRILFFINDTFTVSYDSCPQYNRQTFDIYIGALPNGNQGVVGTIDEVRIYDGWYLSYGYETPPTADEYNQQKLRLAGYQVVDEKSVDLERNLSNASFNPAPFLKVWLPFDTSTTEDVCGNEWVASTNKPPTIGEANAISGNALQVDRNMTENNGTWSLSKTGGITLGGKNFTIKGTFNIKTNFDRYNVFDTWWRPFFLTFRSSSDTREISIDIHRNDFKFRTSCFENQQIAETLNLNQNYSFELVYHHGLSKVFTFLDGIKVAELDVAIPRTAFPYLYLDYGEWHSTHPQATIDEFKIYDGVALHTENFAPATAENYVEKTLAEEGQIHFTFDADTERIVRNAVLVFEHSTEVAEGITTITDLDESKSKDGTAFYQTFQSKCFDLPPVPEIWIEFDVFCDGEHFWSAGNASSANGICGIAANADGSLSFISNGETVKTVEDVCEFGELQTIRLHMITDSSGGVIEAWTGPVLIYTYTGDVNHGDYFEDLFLQSDGEGTFFSSLFISNYSLDRDRYLELLFNTERKLYNGLFNFTISTHQISEIIWAPPGGTYPPNFIIVTDTIRSVSGTAFSQTEIVKCFDLPPAYEIWIDFDVYFDGINRWRAGNAGAAGVCGIVASVDGTLNYICNGEIVHTVADVCAIEKIQPVLLHMVSDCNIPELGIDSGYIECWINGEYIFKYSGEVNFGEDFEDIFLQCDGSGTVFSMITFSTNRLDPRHYEDAPTIYFCVRHNGEIISLPLRNYDSPITPALAVRYDGKNWYGKLVALNDSNAGAVHLRHNNSDYALAIN